MSRVWHLGLLEIAGVENITQELSMWWEVKGAMGLTPEELCHLQMVWKGWLLKEATKSWSYI